MKAQFAWGGAVNTRRMIAAAAIKAGDFVYATLSTMRVTACADDAEVVYGMAMSAAAAAGDYVEVAPAYPGVVYTIPFVANATYTTAVAAVDATTNDPFVAYVGGRFAIEVDTAVDGVHKCDLSDAGTAAKNLLLLMDVEYSYSSASYWAQVSVLNSGNQLLVIWTG